MGYHRLWSHKTFEATLPLRIILAALGTMAFQGSIKWWVFRHRLHHRYFSRSMNNCLTKSLDLLTRIMTLMMPGRVFGTVTSYGSLSAGHTPREVLLTLVTL